MPQAYRLLSNDLCNNAVEMATFIQLFNYH